MLIIGSDATPTSTILSSRSWIRMGTCSPSFGSTTR
jgi:hypothetical protein